MRDIERQFAPVLLRKSPSNSNSGVSRQKLAKEAVEFATLGWVDWFNNRWLLEPGNIPPVEAEERYYAMIAETAVAV
jgi:hypothetical protein